MAEVKIIGQMDNTLDNTFESANRVYDKEGLCPTIPTCAGGGIQPKIIDKYIVAMRGRNPEHPTDRTPGIHTEQRLEMNKDGLVNTLTTVQKDNLLLEKKIQKVGQISSDGSEYGTVISENELSSILAAGTHGYANNCIAVKQATKEGTISERQNSIKTKRLPNGNIRFYRDDEKKSAVSELQVQSGADVAQTITVANIPKIYKEEQMKIKQATKEGSIKCKVGGCYDASYPDSKTRRGRVQEGGDITPTITAQGGENINFVETVYRIRKLTPKECWRLMGYTDKDFEKAAQVNSNTQLYKQAGNAIVKQVLMAIFSQLLN